MRALRVLAWGVLGSIVAIAAILVSVLVNLRVPMVRAAIAREVNGALASSFAGDVRVERLDSVGLGGARVGALIARAPSGATVLRASGVDVRASLASVARAALSSAPIVIDEVRIGDADVSLDVARAFEPRHHGGGPPTLRLDVTRARVARGWVHGEADGFDADVRAQDVAGAVHVEGPRAAVEVDGADVDARSLPRVEHVEGHVAGRLEAGEVFRAVARFDGRVDGTELAGAARLDGDAFVASARAPDVSPAVVRSLAPGAPLRRDGSLDAFAAGTTRAFAFRAHGAVGGATFAGAGDFDDGALHARAVARHVDVRAFVPTRGLTDAEIDASVDVRGGAATGRAEIALAGGRVRGTFRTSAAAVDSDATADVSSARALVAPFADVPGLAGHGVLAGHVRVDRVAGTLDAQASGRLEGVSVSPASADVLVVRASARGALSNPEIALDADAERPVIGAVTARSATFRVRGSARDARVGVRLEARAPLEASARVMRGPAGVDVTDVSVLDDGARVLSGGFSWRGGRAHARIVGRRVDLAHLASTLGLATPLSGTVFVDLDATLAGRSLEGHVVLDGVDVSYDRSPPLRARVEASNTGGACSVMLRARGRAGWVSVEAPDLRLAGPSLELASWERATGSVHVDDALDLGALDELAKTRVGARGWARLALVARRASAAADPDLRAELTTRDASFGRFALAAAATAEIDASGAATLHATASRGAERGAIDATVLLSWTDLLAGRAPDLATLPFALDAEIPAFDATPACDELRLHCAGTAAARAHVAGPLRDLRGTASIELGGFRADVSPLRGPANASVRATFARGGGDATLAIDDARTRRRVLDATAHWNVPERASDWSASVDARMRDAPLRVPPAFATDIVSARVSGTLALDDLHRDARARAELRAADIEADGVATDAATLAASFDGREASLEAHVRSGRGHLDLHATSAATWGAALAPSLAKDARFSLGAGAFRLCSLQPIVPPSLGSIDGTLDADARGELSASRVAATGWAKITGGSLDSSAFGAVRDLRATLRFTPDGARLEDARFRGTRGLVTLTGRVVAPGGALREIDVGATIPKDDPFPLVVAGQRVGDVWGKVSATARAGHVLAVRVDVPALHVTLPSEDQRALQGLGAAPDVTVGVRDRRGALVPVALAPPPQPKRAGKPIVVDVHLGSDVRVRRGDMLDVVLAGNPIVRIGEKTLAARTVRLVRGTLDIESRRFAIEHGTVTFDGDPAKPNLDVAATWDAQDRTRVTAAFVGRPDRGKLTLTSDPPHTQDEIVAMLVFGTADGPTPSTGSATGAVAAATVSGGASVLTQPFNKALEQLTHLDIQTRVDTSGSVAKSAVEVQISKRIWAQVAYVLGLPPPGTDPDRTWLTLAWHATARWSFDFTVGDHGSTVVDALWEHRY